MLVEELPPKSLKKAGRQLCGRNAASLKTQGLAQGRFHRHLLSLRHGVLPCISEDVASQAPDKSVSQKLMPVAVGLDANGQPTPALLKKLSSLCGDSAPRMPLPQLSALEGKVETLFFDSVVKGAMLADGLQKALNDALARLPIARMMTYQLADGWTTVNFVRPAHGLVALHGAEIVPVSVLGLTAGRETQGHRFESSRARYCADADSYQKQLETDGAVIASFEQRHDEIAASTQPLYRCT